MKKTYIIGLIISLLISLIAGIVLYFMTPVLDRVKNITVWNMPLLCSLFLTIIIVFLIFYVYKLKNKFKRYSNIGITGIDKTAEDGLTPKKSLDMITTNLSFFGVGANKLTKEEDAFASAISRVNSRRNKVRLILCHPNNKSIKEIALRSKKSEDAYRKNIISSLKIISRLVNEHKYRIEVRFYKCDNCDKMPIFRIMLINDRHCVLSYYQFSSTHKGEKMTQLHLQKQDSDDYFGLYSAFEEFFNEEWDKLENDKWDSKEFIND